MIHNPFLVSVSTQEALGSAGSLLSMLGLGFAWSQEAGDWAGCCRRRNTGEPEEGCVLLLQGAWLSLVTAFSSTAPLGDLICLPYARVEKMELPKGTGETVAIGAPPPSWDSTYTLSRQLVPLPGLLCAVDSGSVCHSVLLVMVCKAGRIPS